jgi:hypothetical protein
LTTAKGALIADWEAITKRKHNFAGLPLPSNSASALQKSENGLPNRALPKTLGSEQKHIFGRS